MFKLKFFLAIAVALVTSQMASASITVINPVETESVIPNSNDFKSSLMALGFDSIYVGELEFSQSGTLSFYFHGAESGYTNSLNIDGTDVFTEANQGWGGAGTFITTISVIAGDKIGVNNQNRLKFTTNGSSGIDAAMGESGFGIFRNANDSFVGSDGRFYFGYDDNGAGADDNHDDIIISARFSAVPEPGTLAIWSMLGIAGLCGRRRKS